MKSEINSDTAALTGTPSYPLLVFFNPDAIGYNSLGQNLGNEETLFHEALHGFTGKFDFELRSALGLSASTPSCRISRKIGDAVLTQSTGLDLTRTWVCP